MIVLKNWSRTVVFLAIALIAGCGGGSGGGGSGAGEDRTASRIMVSSPTLTSDGFPNISGESIKLVLVGTIKGEFEQLQGKSVFVTVEDPAALFLPTAEVVVTSAGSYLDYRLTLNGKAAATAGRLTGSLRIFVCLDQACRQPLGGTPLTVPYSITVEAGPAMDRSVIDIEVPFGTVPPTEQIGVTWPASSNGFSAGASYVSDPNRPDNLVQIETRTTVPSQFVKQPQFWVVFGPSHPGSFTTTLQVYSELRAPYVPARSVFSKHLVIKYTIVPNPAVDHFFYPARSDFTAAGKVGDRIFPFSLTTTTGVTQSYVGVEYLTWAGTVGPHKSWFQPSPRPLARPCNSQVAPAVCLNAGVYTAQLRYRIKTPAGERDVLYPIAMTVTP